MSLTFFCGTFIFGLASNKDRTVGQPLLETMSSWEGDVEDLARVGGQWCTMLRIEDLPDLTVRLVRDYVQRGILDRPRREGKAAIYGWEHLIRLLAARLLLRDGWPLQKIADELQVLSLQEVRTLLPGSAPAQAAARHSWAEPSKTDPALDALRAIRSRLAERSRSTPARIDSPPAFQQTLPITDRAALQKDLAASRHELGENAAEVASRAYTRLEIASGVELHIEATRLRSLGRSDAYALARVVLASLLNPRLRKEEKPE